MEIDLPQKFVLRRQVYAFQLFGRQLLERIPAEAVIVAESPSMYSSMIEVAWEQRRYLIFERDIRELAEPLNDPTDIALFGSGRD